MIDVVLYRVDRDNVIDLEERTFPDLDALADFFASDAGSAWDWAEVTVPCRCLTVRHSAAELRLLATARPTGPSD